MRQDTRAVPACGDKTRTVLTHLDIVVLAGGPSDEREVSLASGRSVAAALTEAGHRVYLRDISPQDLSALDIDADLIFIALHGTFGEDGQLQRELERRKLRFTGTDAAGSAAAMDKVRSKARFIEAGLPTPRFDVIRPGRVEDIASRWRLPVVIKPVASGSSVNVQLVRDVTALREIAQRVVQRGTEVMIEELIEGPELTCAVLADQPLAPIEIRTPREFYDYEAKYIDDRTEYRFDIALPDPLLRRIERDSTAAARAVGCRDFCRVDWMVDRITHEPYLLEINTIPGFTTHSLLPKAAARMGMSFVDLCQRIVQLAMTRDDPAPQ